MGQAIDEHAAAECVRETLELFLADHPGLEGCEVEVAEHIDGDPPTFGLTINGFVLELTLKGPGQ